MQIKIQNYVKFGKIMRGWAADPTTVPKTVGEFRAAVPKSTALIGDAHADGDPITVFILPKSPAVSIVLPHADDAAAPAPSGKYPVPSFYSTLAFDGATAKIAKKDKEDFKSARIADYAMAKCV